MRERIMVAILCRYLLGLSDGESKERLVDIDARNASGATPLELAATNGHGEVVK